MTKRTYTYIIHKEDGNIISIYPIPKIEKAASIETKEKYLDFENNYKLSVCDIIGILLPVIIFLSFIIGCMLIVLDIM